MLCLPRTAAAAVRGQVSLASPARWRSSASVSVDEVAAGGADAAWLNARPYAAIPGPRPLPVLGNAWRFMPVVGEYHGKPISDVMASMNVDFGPVAKLAGMPGRPDLLIITDSDLVEHVLRNEGPWPIRRFGDSMEYYFKNLRKHCPDSLITSQGKEWQEFRTAINQVMMQPRNTRQYVEPIDRVGQEFVDRMRAIRDDKLEMPDDFREEISKWALESITFVALDTRLNLLKGDVDPDSEAWKMIQAVHVIFDGMYKLDFLPSVWKFVSTPTYRKFIGGMNYFTHVATKYVNQAMDRLKTAPKDSMQDRNLSVLEGILVRSEDPERAVSMALDMLFGGIDTTATAVITIMYQLATHPDKQRKLQAELDRVITDPSQPVTKEQLEEMKYLRAVIKETMRIMPIVLGSSRNTPKDMVVGGYQVPKETVFFMMNRGLFFPRPNEFIPERWLPGGESLKSKNPFDFLPFGFGVRMCAGRRFAELELETVIAKTFRNFTLEWNRPPAKTEFKVILEFVDPLKFTVKDRV